MLFKNIIKAINIYIYMLHVYIYSFYYILKVHGANVTCIYSVHSWNLWSHEVAPPPWRLGWIRPW